MSAMTLQVTNKDGLTFVDGFTDAGYRKALMDGVPPSLRAKMQEALAAVPGKGAAAHSMRYFGKELDAKLRMIGPLLDELEDYIRINRKLPDLHRWLVVTGFANDYRMIKVMAEWAELCKVPPAKVVTQ